jgi:uncharacterized protein with GYD domain
MSFYLWQASYTPEAVKAMMAKPQDRSQAAAQIIEALGGKLHHFFFSMGTSDLVALIEVPDDKAMVAGSMIVASTGALSSVSTTKLIAMDEAVQAMEMAGKTSGAYKPPTG